jgi:hypothetical protein
MSKSFSVADVASHKDADSGLYIIIDDGVYDVTGLFPSSPLLSPIPQKPFPSAFPFLSSLPTPTHPYPPLPKPKPKPNFERREAIKIKDKFKEEWTWWLTKRTGFIDEHPGGSKILKRVAGKDASKQFWKYHNEGVLKKYTDRLKIGSVEEKAKL